MKRKRRVYWKLRKFEYYCLYFVATIKPTTQQSLCLLYLSLFLVDITAALSFYYYYKHMMYSNKISYGTYTIQIQSCLLIFLYWMFFRQFLFWYSNIAIWVWDYIFLDFFFISPRRWRNLDLDFDCLEFCLFRIWFLWLFLDWDFCVVIFSAIESF